MVGTMGPGWRIPYRTLLTAMAATQRIARPETKRGSAAAVLFGAISLASLSTAANAAIAFNVRFESERPGMQNTTATFSLTGVETFESRSTGTGKNFTSDFGTGGLITGSYSNVQINNKDQYGGAGGVGKYAVTFTTTGYSLDLATQDGLGVNYFGYWLSALDRGNQVTFYSRGEKLFTFNPSDVLAAVAAKPNPSAYYGNPNPQFAGRNTGEPYLFVNFFHDRGTFDRIVFAENPRGGGYESDNHTVGRFLTKGTGSNVVVTGVPEPTVWASLIAGFAMVGMANRRKIRAITA